MVNSEKLIAKFLRVQSISSNVSRYILRHAAKGKVGHEVETFEITEALEESELENLATVIVARAQSDADGIGPRIQRYVLFAATADESIVGRQPFRIKGAVDLELDGDDEDGEEAPTVKGLTSQLMRHNEANNRTMMAGMGTIMNSFARRLESQDKLIERFMEDRVRMFEVVEEAMSRKHEREMEMESNRAKDARMALGLQKILSLLPVALSAFSKGKIPSSKDPMVLMIEELVTGLNEDQLKAIAGALQPEQRIMLLQVFKTIQERKSLPEGQPGNAVQKEN